MAKNLKPPAAPDEVVMNKIYMVRNQKLMLDRDLAELYGVETKVLKQAVQKNRQRFPEDFMFEMNNKEFADWRSQSVTSKKQTINKAQSSYRKMRYLMFRQKPETVKTWSSKMEDRVSSEGEIE